MEGVGRAGAARDRVAELVLDGDARALRDPPAVMVEGWAVMASLLSAPTFTVIELVTAVFTPPLEVSDAVMV